MPTIDSEHVISRVNSEITRIEILIEKKQEERSILKREIETLEEEIWKYEDLRTYIKDNANGNPKG